MVIIDDELMSKACSSDAYIYLLYLKWWAIYLFFLSVVGVFFLCPFYYFGAEDGKIHFLQRITVGEIIHSEWRIWVIFAISITYSIIGYKFVYNLVIHFKNFLYYKEENESLSEDYRASRKTVMLVNIPEHLTVKECNLALHTFFLSRFVLIKCKI